MNKAKTEIPSFNDEANERFFGKSMIRQTILMEQGQEGRNAQLETIYHDQLIAPA